MITTGIIFGILFGSFVLFYCWSLLQQYLLFVQSKEYDLRTRILNHSREVDKRIKQVKQQYQDQEAENQKVIEGLTSKSLKQLACNTPVQRLADYEGIGPASIDQLLRSGFSNLDDCLRAGVLLPDLGPVRSRCLGNAIRTLVKELTETITRQYQTKAGAELLAQKVPGMVTSKQLISLKESLLGHRKKLEPYLKLASQIHFIHWLQKKLPAIPPDQDKCLNEAKIQFTRIEAQSFVESSTQDRVSSSSSESPKQKEQDLFRQALQTADPAELPRTQANNRMENVRLMIQFGLAIARYDGRVAEAERVIIRNFVEERFAGDSAIRLQIPLIMTECEKNRISLEVSLMNCQQRLSPVDQRKLGKWAEAILNSTGKWNEKKKKMFGSGVKWPDDFPPRKAGIACRDTWPISITET